MTTDLPKTLEVRITSSAFEGVGVGRVDGKVILVERALKGDHLLVEISEEKKNFCRARPLKALSNNPLRRPSPCALSEQCRGCPWIEIDYGTQLEWKKQILRDSLKRLGQISFSEPIEVIGSPDILGYRNRITVRGYGEGGGKTSAICLGYIGDDYHPFPIKGCPIACESINHFLDQWESLATGLAEISDPIEFRMEIQESPALRESHKKHLVLSLKSLQGDPTTYRILIERLNNHPLVACADFENKSSHPLPFEAPSAEREITTYTYPGLFQQVNLKANGLMQRKIAQWVDEAEEVKEIWDLYCGTGNLSFGLLSPKRNLVGVEINPLAVECANQALTKNQITANPSFIAGSVRKFLNEQVKKGGSSDLIIIDPPRAGVKEEMRLIARIKPNYLILVSCNPTTLARDLAAVGPDGYQIQKIALFDFFPNSYHFETVCFLKLQR